MNPVELLGRKRIHSYLAMHVHVLDLFLSNSLSQQKHLKLEVKVFQGSVMKFINIPHYIFSCRFDFPFSENVLTTMLMVDQ